MSIPDVKPFPTLSARAFVAIFSVSASATDFSTITRLVAVQGNDAYVSPDWYASAEQVPTWLYEAVHLSGPVRVVPGDHTQGHTEALSAKFENWIEGKQPWLLDKVSDKRKDMLLKGIIAVEMTVETIEGNFKLNQHKGDEDHAAIATALAAQDDPSSQAIARRMVALRPHLDYLPQPSAGPALMGIAAK